MKNIQNQSKRMSRKTHSILLTPLANKFYLLLDLNQWLPPYESNTLTTELSRPFIITKNNKWGPITSMDYKLNITYKQYQSKRSKNYLILTRNYLHDKIGITSIRAIAQLGRAPRLHERQCFFFRGVHLVIQKVYLIVRNPCLTPFSV